MCLKTDVWVLCRVCAVNSPSAELIVVQEKDFNFWAKTYPREYEFIAKGRHSVMSEYKKLAKETV